MVGDNKPLTMSA